MSDSVNPLRVQEIIRTRAILFDIPMQAVIATTSDGAIVYWGESASTMYGWDASEVMGRDVTEITPAELVRGDAAEIMRTLRAGKSWSGEFRVRRRNGAEFVAQVQDVPVRGPTGELIGIIGISRQLRRNGEQ